MGLKQPMSEKQIFTTMEAAQYLGVSYSTMRTWIDLPPFFVPLVKLVELPLWVGGA
jgi:hypothetical protein